MSHGIFPAGWASWPHIRKIKLKLLVLFLDEFLSLKNKSCVIEKMQVPALRFVYSHSFNDYVKVVSASTRQIKLKKILIKQKHVIRIMFQVNEETRARPSFQELNTLEICQINLSSYSVFIKSSYSCRKSEDLHPLQYFLATLKLLTMCMKPDFLNII